MKKIVIAIAFAVVAVSAASANAAFTTNLTVGSTGSEVTALQTWLVSKGFLTMPAGVSMGYFGNLTKSAVSAYQATVGLPTTGFFGPMTRAKLATVATTGTTMTAPVSVSCPAGFTCAPVAGTTATTDTTLGNTDGSLTVSDSSYVSSSQTLKKGDVKDVFSLKLQATSGKVSVNRFDVHFNSRPWLLFSELTLKDANGTVIAKKALNSSADATEVTVGSDYLVRFDGINYTVTPGADATVVVGTTVVSSSDKITGQTVTLSVPTGSIRTVNGIGYTDSVGTTKTVALTLSSTGSTATLYTRVSPNTPAQRIITTSVSQNTPDVVLGVFSVKTQNRDATINNLSININNSTGVATSTIFQNVRLVDGSNSYGANSLSAGNTTFTNLTIALAQDVWKDLKVVADVQQNISGVSASTTLATSSINGVDTNFSNIDVTSASNATGNDVQFLASGVSVSNISSSFTAANGSNGSTKSGGVSFGFTLTNTGNSDVYISKSAGVALGTSTTGSVGSPATASSTLTDVTATPGTYASDTSVAYVIPAGASRALVYSGGLDNTNGTVGIRVFKISQINFGSTSGNTTSSNVNFGLESLKVSTYLNN